LRRIESYGQGGQSLSRLFVCRTFSEDEAVHDGGYARGRLANVDDQRGAFPCCKRIQYACIRDVECGHLELLEHDFGHAFAVDRGVPRGLGDEDRMVFRFAVEDVFERVADQRRDNLEVGDCDVGVSKNATSAAVCRFSQHITRRTQALGHWVPDLHAFSPDGRPMLSEVQLALLLWRCGLGLRARF